MTTQDHGTVMYKGKELTLRQQPFCDSCPRRYDGDLGRYAAMAVDADDFEYEVTWDITNEEAEAEEDACDWDDYSVRKIGQLL